MAKNGAGWRRGRFWAAGAVVLAMGAQSLGCIFSVPECVQCTGGSGEGGSAGGTPVGCVPSENAGAVGDECGVFVSAGGDDGAAGTKGAPLKTLGAAVARAEESGARRVYACAEIFGEALEVPAGVTLYGGLDCGAGWVWAGETKKTVVEGEADAIALKLLGGEGTTRVEDVAARAADAVMAGGNSIAVLVDGATAELVRCELSAGNGAEGEKGAPGAEPDGAGQIPAASAGAQGNEGKDACSDVDGTPGPDATLGGGTAVVNDCGNSELSLGGKGGDGNIANGDNGQPGQTGVLGSAGMGEPLAGNWTCAAEGNGQGGDDGSTGDPGLGASGLGALSSTGYLGVSGGPGTTGKPGQGGGGGGGAKGGAAICPGGVAGAGASGGSGGAGGCGGQPGQGGGPGGASIALASVNASVTLTGCTLTAGSGGNGGAGGDLQPGGGGGQPGTGGTGTGGTKDACDGGKGGQGGNGGPGGGGLGGPSLGIAFTAIAVTMDSSTTVTVGAGGIGGPGGNSNLGMNAGGDGIAAQELELP